MPVSVNYVYQEVQNLANKSQAGGFLSKDEYNGYAVLASRQLFDELAPLFQKEQWITELLQPFLKLKPVSPDQYGYIPYPSDYEYYGALSVWAQPDPNCADPADYKTLPQIPVKALDFDKIAYRLSSELNPPTLSNPVCEFTARGIRIYPITNGVLRYLRTPATPFWNAVPNQYGIDVYTPTGSTDFDWDANAAPKLIYKIAKMLGVEIRDSELYQAADKADKES